MDRDNDIIFLDTETDSRFANKAKLAEIFLMRCRGPRLMPISYLEVMCSEAYPMKAEAYKVNGIEDHWIELADPGPEVRQQVFDFIRPTDTLVGHNIKRYDKIVMSSDKIKYENKIIDTMDLAASAGFPKGKRSQNHVYNTLFPDSPMDSHRAIVDVKKLRKIYIELKRRISEGKLF